MTLGDASVRLGDTGIPVYVTQFGQQTTGGGTSTTWPTVQANDIAILMIKSPGNNSIVSGFTNRVAFIVNNAANGNTMSMYGKRCDGTETGTTLDVDFASTGGTRFFRCAIFRGVDPGIPIWYESMAFHHFTASGTWQDEDVTTSKANSLAINEWFVSANVRSDEPVGETGGTWVERFDGGVSSPVYGFGVDTADMATPGTVGGGVGTWASGTPEGFIFGIALFGKNSIFYRNPPDALHLADVVTRVATLFRTVTGALQFADAVTSVKGVIRTATDALHLADAVTHVKNAVRTTTDALQLADVATRTVSLVRAVSDALHLADVATRVVTNLRSTTDALGLSDAATRVVAFVRTAADHITFSDAAVIQVIAGIIQRFATDALSLSDSATRSIGSVRSAIDALSLADAATRIGVFIRFGAAWWRGAFSVTHSIAQSISNGNSNALGTNLGYLTEVKTDVTSVTAGATLEVLATVRYRVFGADIGYSAKVVWTSGGGATLRIILTSSGATLAGPFTLAFPSANDPWSIRIQTTQTNPTTIKAKAWRSASAEPDWQLSVTDSDAGAQNAGGFQTQIFTTTNPFTPVTWTVSQYFGYYVLSMGDAATRVTSALRTTTDALHLSDVATRALTLIRATTDHVTLSDAVTGIRVILRSAVDALHLSDVATRTISVVRSTTDALHLADTATRIVTAIRTATDALHLADVATRLKLVIRSVTDTLHLVDVATRTVSLARSTVDSLHLADLAQRVKTVRRTTTDALHLADVATRVKVAIRTVNDALHLSDTVSRSVATARNAVDSLHLGDVATRAVTAIRSTTDHITLTDLAQAASSKVRSAVDSLHLADVATRSVGLIRTVQDGISLFDSAILTPIIRNLGAVVSPILRTSSDISRMMGRQVRQLRGNIGSRTRTGKRPRRLR
jgi:hypothetical protein